MEVPRPKVEIEEPEAEEPSSKRGRSFSIMCLVASVLQSITTTNYFPVDHEFVKLGVLT